MLLLQTFNMIIPLLTIPYVTRILGPEGYGQFSIALTWILYFQVIVEYGFELTGARAVASNNDKNAIENKISGILTARLYLLLFSFVAMVIVWWLSGLPLYTLICMLLLFTMVVGTTLSLTWVFQGMQKLQFITIINVIARTISVILIFLFVKHPEHIYRYCLFYAVTFLISGLFGCYVCNYKLNLKFHIAKFSHAVQELKFGWYLFISAAMICIFSNIGITFLTYSVTEGEIGAYSAIHKISYIMNILFVAVSKSIYPYISKSFSISENEGLKKIRQILKPVMIFFLLLGVILVLFQNLIVSLVFGNEYVAYSYLILPFVLQIIFAVANNFIGIQSLVANGHQKEYSMAITLGMLAIVTFNFLLINMYGISGAAYASVLAEAFLTLILLFFYYKIYKKK